MDVIDLMPLDGFAEEIPVIGCALSHLRHLDEASPLEQALQRTGDVSGRRVALQDKRPFARVWGERGGGVLATRQKLPMAKPHDLGRPGSARPVAQQNLVIGGNCARRFNRPRPLPDRTERGCSVRDDPGNAWPLNITDKVLDPQAGSGGHENYSGEAADPGLPERRRVA